MHNFLAAWRQRQAWQRDGGVKVDSVAAAFGSAAQLHSAASSGHGHASRHQCHTATARCRGGNVVKGKTSQKTFLTILSLDGCVT